MRIIWDVYYGCNGKISTKIFYFFSYSRFVSENIFAILLEITASRGLFKEFSGVPSINLKSKTVKMSLFVVALVVSIEFPFSRLIACFSVVRKVAASISGNCSINVSMYWEVTHDFYVNPRLYFQLQLFVYTRGVFMITIVTEFPTYPK